MDKVTLLTDRLSEIAAHLEKSPDALGLLGLGSVGKDTHRLDVWSDLDFFVIVRPGCKPPRLDDTSWLHAIHPVSWIFRNTKDGFKILFDDGIFAEMALFEPEELPSIPYSEGRWIWRHGDLDPGLSVSRNQSGTYHASEDIEYVLGEWLSCLYVGLCRYRRGEKLSAFRFIQGFCLDRFLELIDSSLPASPTDADRYNRERRFEARFPEPSRELASFLPGYDGSPQAAMAMLDWVEARYPINQALAAEIRNLGPVLP